jgi:hypothetical protein
MDNPFQDVIDWLHSDEGMAWSEARLLQGFGSNTLTCYGDATIFNWQGIMSVKRDDKPGIASVNPQPL